MEYLRDRGRALRRRSGWRCGFYRASWRSVGWRCSRLLFALTYTLDSLIQASNSVTGLPIFFAGSAAAARALLSAIVGSLITVIATIFSVTIVMMQPASSQYSPRLLQRFITDRLVQVVGCRRLVRVSYPSFDEVVEMAFDRIRRAAFTGGQVAVLERVLDIIERAISGNRLPERREALWSRVYLLARQSTYQIPDSHDITNLCRRAITVAAPLRNWQISVMKSRAVAASERLSTPL